ncbi:MAG TPA: hypothetical protein VJ343_01945 [archaeon]|nr:hypothetical protein [archaeon]
MEPQEIIDAIINFIHSIFFFPKDWLAWPTILSAVILPVVLLWYAFYKILERLGIFRYKRGINAVIAGVISFLMIPIAPVTLFFSVGAIALIGLRSWKSRIAFIAVFLIFYFLVMPFLSTIQL